MTNIKINVKWILIAVFVLSVVGISYATPIIGDTITAVRFVTSEGFNSSNVTQGVRTTDSPTFVTVNASNIMGVINASRYATLQDALNASAGEVYIPAGTYLLSSPLRVNSSITITGAGRGRTILRATNTSYFYNSTAEERAVIENWNHFVAPGDSNIIIKSLTIDGNISNINPTKVLNKNPLSGIKLGWVQNSTIEDVEVHDVASFGIGIWGRNTGTTFTPKSVIKGNYVWNINYNSDGILTDGRFSAGIFSSNNINSGVSISDNKIWNATNGIEFEDGALEDSVSNNYISDCTNVSGGAGIQTTNGGYDMQITGNIISSCYDGINLKYGTGTNVLGNTINKSFNHGIVLGGSLGGQQIIGNTIRRSNATGISILTGVSGATVMGNSIESAGINTSNINEDRSGIRVQAADNKIIANNIYDLDGAYTMTWAVNMTSGTGMLVTLNRIVPAHFTIGTISVPAGNLVFNNIGLAPMDFGNQATAPSDVSFGNTYKNSTSGDGTCYATGSEYRNATGNTVVC